MSHDYRGDPILGPVLTYWVRKRGPRAMPRKADIDPLEVPAKLLPNLQVIEVVDGGARFRYRLVGTASVQAYGKDYTGRHTDELLTGDRLRSLQSIYNTVCVLKVPVFTRNRYHTPKNVDVFTCRIYMPLSNNATDVHHILGILRFEASARLDGGSFGEAATLDLAEQYVEPIEIGRPISEVAA
jgi:hypothetical protein